MSEKMGSIVRMPVKENKEEALKPLQRRIIECDNLRKGLIAELHRYTNDANHVPTTADRLRTYIINFEMKAIDPARAYVEAVQEDKVGSENIHAYTVALDTWITDIESEYQIDWGAHTTSAVVFPFKPNEK